MISPDDIKQSSKPKDVHLLGVSDLESIVLDKKSNFDEIAEAIERLRQMHFMENEFDGESILSVAAKKVLEKVLKKRREFFIKLLVKSAMSLPLENEDISFKKQVLSFNTDLQVDLMPDEDVEALFLEFIHDNYEYCKWSEYSNLKSVNENPSLKKYFFGTFDPRDSYSSREDRKFVEDSAFCPAAIGYGAVYGPSGEMSLFKRDELFDKSEEIFNIDDEPMKLSSLELYLNRLKKATKDNNVNLFMSSLCIISFLPEAERVSLEKSLDFVLPISLYKNISYADREQYINSNSSTCQSVFEKLSKGEAFSLLVSTVESAASKVRDLASKEYFGWKDNSIDDIDFFLSFIDWDPFRVKPPHHTFFYYLNIRSNLPDDLVEEFEKMSGLVMPRDLINIDYDSFLKLSPQRLFDVFKNVGQEPKAWLKDKLIELSANIQKKLPKAELLSVQEFFLENGYDTDEVTVPLVLSYISLMDLKIRSQIKDIFNVEISDFDLRVQLSILNFLAKKDESDVRVIASMIHDLKTQKERNDAFLVMLASEGFEPVEGLMYHYSQVPDIARVAYSKYSELISEFDRVEQFLLENFKTKYEKVHIKRIREELIKKANSVLVANMSEVYSLNTMLEISAGQDMMQDYYEEDQEELDHFKSQISPDFTFLGQDHKADPILKTSINNLEKKIIESFEQLSNDLIITLSCFKTLKESGVEFSIEDVESFKLESYSGGSLSDEDIEKMSDIYSNNQKSSGAHDSLVSKFKQRAKDKGTSLYVLKKNKDILAFVAFSKVSGSDMVEASSFNVSPDARGFKLGEAMLQEVIDKQAMLSVLFADCYAGLDISSKYIETGWAATRFSFEENKKTGEQDKVIDIIRDEKSNKKYWGKGKSKELIASQKDIPENIRIASADSQSLLPFEKLNQGYILTRMFTHTDGKSYAVFERSESAGEVAKSSSK